mgnify:CR=1 FL=1
MAFLFPVLAAFLQAGSVTLDKAILRMRHVNFRDYTGVSFPLIFLLTGIAFLIVRPPLHWELLTSSMGLLIILSAGITIVSNAAYYRALDADSLVEMETIGLLFVVPTIIATSVLFTDERNIFVLIPACIATAAVLWSHWEGHHFRMAKKTLPYFLWALAAAPLQATMIKILLRTWDPIALELVRSLLTGTFFGFMFRQSLRTVSGAAFRGLVATNILSVIAWFLVYYSYQRSGIIYTLLLFSLQPFLVYWASFFILKERLQWRKIVAFHVVIVAIVTAEILRRS